MDLLIEKGNNRTYLSRYKVITTSFEESSPSVKRNNTQIQYRNGNVDFGGWNESKTIDYVGYYRAEDLEDEEYLRERIYALLSDPEGYYITQLKNDNDDSFERPGETSGDYFDKQVNRPSHKRFYVYASSLESELIGSYGGHVLYKMSVEFTTLKLPYGESVPRNLDVKPNVPYIGRNLLVGTSRDLKTAPDSSDEFNGGNIHEFSSDELSILSGKQVTVRSFIHNTTTHTVNLVIWTNGGVFGVGTGVPAGADGYSTVTVYNATSSVTRGDINIRAYTENTAISGVQYKELKLEKGTTATPYNPAPSDPEYSAWHTKIYYNIDNLVIPYAGTVACNQIEQGFTIEFTAKEAGSNLKLSLNGIDFIAPGNVYSGDVFKLSGYEYLRNGISIVKATNKAYFKLLPGISNKISSSIAGEIRILNFQNLYA